MQKTRNRKDHIIPASYLRGFVHPERSQLQQPLWVFDVASNRWDERSPKEIAFRKGFYDYGKDISVEQTADQAFEKLERSFPRVRDAIIEQGFDTWKQHREFLLSYGQMLRSRSLLFRTQSLTESNAATILTVTEIVNREPDPNDPKQSLDTLKVEKFCPKDEAEKNRLFRNKAITDMRTEIQKGPDWLSGFKWTLQYSEDAQNPVITSDQPIIVDGTVKTLDEAILGRHPDTLIFFPLSWQMCLVGSPRSFIEPTAKFHSADLERLRGVQRQMATEFLASTCQLRFGII